MPSHLQRFDESGQVAGGGFTRAGPDGMETVTQLDLAGRVQSYRRGMNGQTPLLESTATYYDNGLLKSFTNGNGTVTEYTYDAASRVTVIDHRTQASPGGQSNLKLVYSYDRRNLPTQIIESSETGLVAPTTTTYTYDARGRLIAESRSTPDTNGIAYDLEYDYDAGGNRTEKRDFINDRRVVYTYDYQGPSIYGSANNRLAFYWTYDMSGRFISTTYYFYNGIGNPTNVVTEIDRPVGVPKFSATRFIYGSNGQTVMFMLGETWDSPNFQGPCYGAYNITFAREFRYDGGQQRYLVRELDPTGLMSLPTTFDVLSETWTDYDGDNAYGDFTVTSGSPPMQAKQYEPGLGTIDDPAGSPVSKYLHNNHLGTLRTTSTTNASTETLHVFTTFGEPVTNAPSTNTDRHGYIGALGYQAPTSDTVNDPYTNSPYLHVGARYYDPAIGRFLQRDPIGGMGGLNVYAYVDNSPTVKIDPSGFGGSSIEHGLWQKIIQGSFDDALVIIEDCGFTGAKAERLRRIVSAARKLDKWRKQVRRLSRKGKLSRLKTLRKTLNKHIKKYNNHSGSNEIAGQEYQVKFLESLLKKKSGG